MKTTASTLGAYRVVCHCSWIVIMTLLTACHNPSEPVDEFIGSYELVSFDGKVVPFQSDLGNGCNRQVTRGALRLAQAYVETGPLFNWEVRAIDSCGSTAPQPVFVVFDNGLWSRKGESIVVFDPMSGSNYSGQISRGGATLTVIFAYAGHNLEYRFTSKNTNN